MIEFKKEQVFIVTGASSGIGEAVAILLNELGATVIAIARNENRLNKMKSKCKNPENMHIEIKDLTENINELPNYIKSLKEKYGKFSGMAYCAGVACIYPIRMVDMNILANIFNVNYYAPIMMIKGILDKRNRLSAEEGGGSIVCISSIDAKLSSKGQSIYAGSKAALSASVKSISKEVASSGFRLNCVLPSIIETPMSLSPESPITENINPEEYPIGWGKPQDVANMIIYLLSDKAKFISGQNYIIDTGGVL